MKKVISQKIMIIILIFLSINFSSAIGADVGKGTIEKNISKREIDDSLDKKAFEDGLKVIKTFYEYLLSDCDLSECPYLFTFSFSSGGGDEKYKKYFLMKEWDNLRKDRKLFFKLTKNYEIPDNASEFFDKALKGYCFYNPSENDYLNNLNTSTKYIVLMDDAIEGVSDVKKYIFFGIRYDRNSGEYRINHCAILINGMDTNFVIEDPLTEGIWYSYSKRDFDLFRCLGFDKEEDKGNTKIESLLADDKYGLRVSEKDFKVKSEREITYEYFEEGLKLIDIFYKYLLSDCDVRECPAIFTDCLSEEISDEKESRSLLAQEWDYLRKNKKLFLKLTCKCEIPPGLKDKFLGNSFNGYLFLNPPDVQNLSQASVFYITKNIPGVRHYTLDSMWKRIYFPIKYVSKSGQYKISLKLININGVFIAPKYKGKYSKYSVHYDRNYDLFKALGVVEDDREYPEDALERYERVKEKCEKDIQNLGN